MAVDRFQFFLELTEEGKIKIHTEGPGTDDRMDPLPHDIVWDGYKAGIEHGVDPADEVEREDLKAMASYYQDPSPVKVLQDNLDMSRELVLELQGKLIEANTALLRVQGAVMRAPATCIEESLRDYIMTSISERGVEY